MTPKQIMKRLEVLLAKQAKLRDQMRELESELSEHGENADGAVRALEDAADAVSGLL